MYPFVVLLGLSVGVSVITAVLAEVLPVKLPRALSTTSAVLIAAGMCWALDYSVFTAFHQSLRSSWMNPVASGLVLVGVGELTRTVVEYLGGVLRGIRTTAHV